MAQNDIYQAVTDRILELLDRGVAPWRQPIRGQGNSSEPPSNLHTNRHYRGINVFLLAVTAWAEGYASPHWLTFRQAQERGGHVRKGEKGSLVIFWKQHTVEDRETGKPKTIPVLRRYTVFNAVQCEGVGVPELEPVELREHTPIARAEAIVAGFQGGPKIERGGLRALYNITSDTVRIPEPGRFTDDQSYYATLMHELAHATGHGSRLDRRLARSPAPFGSPEYSKEELIAEMGAAFLAAEAGISPETLEQSAAYIDGWRERIGNDNKLVIQAAGAGQRAADWVMGVRRPEHP